MAGDSEDRRAAALEDIAYLARSANRLQLLEALANGAETRGGLYDQTGIARTTVDRIVNELEDRGWVERTADGTYTATPTGKQVAAEFMPLVESLAVVRMLGDTIDWIQRAEPMIDLQHFADATVRRPESADPMAPTAYLTERLAEADTFHCLVGVAPPLGFETTMRDGAVERGMAVEHVITTSEYAYLCEHPDRVRRWREYIRAGANVYRYDGTVPCNLLRLDETVYIGNSQAERGETYTLIESDDPAVRSWANGIIETYRDRADPLAADEFG